MSKRASSSNVFRAAACGLGFLALSACGAAVENEPATEVLEAGEVGKLQEAIKSGKTFPDLSSGTARGSVLVYNWDGSTWATCSGRIFSRDAVLTAGHCFRTNVAVGATPPNSGTRDVGIWLQTSTGWTCLTPASDGDCKQSGTFRVNPSYTGWRSPAGVWSSDNAAFDTATLRIGNNFPAITINDAAALYNDDRILTSGWGLGYGTNDTNGSGLLYGGVFKDIKWGAYDGNSGANKVFLDDTQTLATDPKGCPGDSGGPLLADGRIVWAVLSKQNCSTRTIWASVRSNLSFIMGGVPAGRCVDPGSLGMGSYKSWLCW